MVVNFTARAHSFEGKSSLEFIASRRTTQTKQGTYGSNERVSRHCSRSFAYNTRPGCLRCYFQQMTSHDISQERCVHPDPAFLSDFTNETNPPSTAGFCCLFNDDIHIRCVMQCRSHTSAEHKTVVRGVFASWIYGSRRWLSLVPTASYILNVKYLQSTFHVRFP